MIDNKTLGESLDKIIQLSSQDRVIEIANDLKKTVSGEVVREEVQVEEKQE